MQITARPPTNPTHLEPNRTAATQIRPTQIDPKLGSSMTSYHHTFGPAHALGRCAAFVLLGLAVLLGPGCVPEPPGGRMLGKLDGIWGRRGLSEGRLQKPRAMAIDKEGLVYVVDMTARIQVFNPEGEFVRGWRTPQFENGKPCGLTFNREGNLLVADTHYFRMLVYKPDGTMVEELTIGGEAGSEPGKFSFVTDCVQDSDGNYYISEYGECDRIQKFTPEGEFILQWGEHGDEPGQFVQPRSLAVDDQDRIWVTDACNHRIQVFDATGDTVKQVYNWGEEGKEPGMLSYPYGIALDGQGHVFVCEFGASRVQKFTEDGKYLGYWGTPGDEDGELNAPWEIAFDAEGKLLVLDTYNHRVQTIRL